MSKYSIKIRKICVAALFLVLGWLLPLITGRIPTIGKMLCPMHIPVMLCGYILGGWYGLLIGLITPITRFVIFGMPTIYPTGLCMMFELGTYGLVSGFLYSILYKKAKLNNLFSILVSLVVAMLVGRIVWAISRYLCGMFDHNYFTWKMFLMGGFVNAWAGIVLQLLLIPSIVLIISKIDLIKKLNMVD